MICEPCAEYRRGERDNRLVHGARVHVCERIPPMLEGGWVLLVYCPCGCEDREIGAIDRDKEIYGNAFLGPLGERIDPALVRSV